MIHQHCCITCEHHQKCRREDEKHLYFQAFNIAQGVFCCPSGKAALSSIPAGLTCSPRQLQTLSVSSLATTALPQVNSLMFLIVKKCLITSVPSLLFFNFHLCSWYYHLVDIIYNKLRIYILQENWRLIGGGFFMAFFKAFCMGAFSLNFFISSED